MRWERLQAAWLLAGIGLAPGCSFDQAGLIPDAGSGGPDGPVTTDGPAAWDAPRSDAPETVIDATPPPDACVGATLGIELSNLDPCDVPAPGDALEPAPGDWLIHTDNGTLYSETLGASILITSTVVAQQTGGPDVRVVSTAGLTLNAGTRLFVRGSLPLVVVSFGDVTIADAFFLGASGARPGPGGGLPVACNAGAGENGVMQNDAGSGGGGGAYGGDGGGGAKVAGATGGPVAADGGNANGNAAITPLRGGCTGGSGANNPSGGGIGGGGGGALQLSVGGLLNVTGSGAITARGGGGMGTEEWTPNADDEAGGGGGGSGGAILLEAMQLTIDGYVVANGGGGGEGTYGGASYPGQHGEDGYSFSEYQAGGGGDWSGGGDGGDGGAAIADAEDGAQGDYNLAGGGGGGGGVGRIHFNSVNLPSIGVSAVISPAEA